MAIADLAGGRWPGVAREAAVHLMVTAQGSNATAVFLMDVWVSFQMLEKKRAFSRDLVLLLNRLPARPWAEDNADKKPLTELELANRLCPYGVRPRTMWIEGKAGKGYAWEDVEDVFERYVPPQMLREARAEG